jgi:hypothetical protein
MKAQLATRLLFILFLLGSTALWLSSFAGESNEKLTGLPFHAGLTFQQEVDSAVCGKKAQINL